MARPPSADASPYILFFPCGGVDNASARTRLYAYLPCLAERGFRWHLASYTWHKYDSRKGLPKLTVGEKLWLELLPLRTFVAFFRADTLFFQKLEIRPFFVKLGKWLGKRIIYDLDDALYLETPEHKAAGEAHPIRFNPRTQPRIEGIMKLADLVLVSGDELARYALERAERVRILPSVVDKVAEKPSPGSQKPVIGWVGAPENQRYLREIEPALQRLQTEIPDLDVWIVTSKLMDPPPAYRYRFIPWSREAEAEAIPHFTVGIAPLADDPWCRAKMNFKAIVYMSFGVPAVVTPVGFPVDDFHDGQSIGYARTTEEWYEQLGQVLGNAARRDALAAGGLKVVHDRFTARGRAGEFAAVLRGDDSRDVPLLR